MFALKLIMKSIEYALWARPTLAVHCTVIFKMQNTHTRTVPLVHFISGRMPWCDRNKWLLHNFQIRTHTVVVHVVSCPFVFVCTFQMTNDSSMMFRFPGIKNTFQILWKFMLSVKSLCFDLSFYICIANDSNGWIALNRWI